MGNSRSLGLAQLSSLSVDAQNKFCAHMAPELSLLAWCRLASRFLRVDFMTIGIFWG